LELIEKVNLTNEINGDIKDWLKILSRECALSFLEELKKVKEIILELEDLD
jgi:hypothetical protein